MQYAIQCPIFSNSAFKFPKVRPLLLVDTLTFLSLTLFLKVYAFSCFRCTALFSKNFADSLNDASSVPMLYLLTAVLLGRLFGIRSIGILRPCDKSFATAHQSLLAIMLFTTTEIIIAIGSIILILFALAVLMSNNPKTFERAIENASLKTQFNTTYFEIYDKSDESRCNRLIIVQPFKWHIWAINGQVFLLNESNKQCPLNYTPAIVVPSTGTDLSNQVFKDLCINKVFNTVVTSYTDKIIPVKVDYSITELQQTPGKFTILDALNYLFTSYITMVSEEPPSEIRNSDNNSLMHLKGLILANNKKLETYTVDINDSIKNYKLQKILDKSFTKKRQHHYYHHQLPLEPQRTFPDQ
ncbi:ODV-E28 [Penaeus vannamei nudivirus]|nr:ODV-E28 [Penaeus vannamei nucleopolyhedrovirus]